MTDSNKKSVNTQKTVEIGQRIRRARWAKSMTQTALADALGIKFQQIQKYETGKNRIAACRLTKVAEVLDVKVDWLLGVKDDEASPVSKQDYELAMAIGELPDEIRISLKSVVDAFSSFQKQSEIPAIAAE